MVIEEYRSKVEKVYLLEITTREGLIFRYQNYFRNQDYTYNSQQYEYLPFFYGGMTSNIDIENEEARVVLPLTEEILLQLRINNNFSRANVQILRVFIDEPNRYPITYNLQIERIRKSFTMGEGGSGDGSIEVYLRSAFNAIEALIPNIYYNSSKNPDLLGAVPEHPRKGLRVNLS